MARFTKDSKGGQDSRDGGEDRPKHFGKRNTHFLCFPLVFESSVSQLATSLQHFRDISTEPQREAPIKPARTLEELSNAISIGQGQQDEKVIEHEDSADDPLGNLSLAKEADETFFANSLKILPRIVHRPPGTFHLTIGVMNLAEKGDMQRAVDIFQSLDLPQMMAAAQQGPPKGTKLSRQWTDQSTSTLNEDPVNTVGKSVAPSESKKDGSEGNTSISPITINLVGLGAFASSKRARVVFAHPIEHNKDSSDTSSRLLNLAYHIAQPFREAGLILETRPIVLHATIANMRYKVQARGGRTSKGSKWSRGKKRWDEGQVDASQLCQVMNSYAGDVTKARQNLGKGGTDDTEKGNDLEEAEVTDDDETIDDRGQPNENDFSDGYIWARDIRIDRVAICKMGSTKSDDPVLGEVYPPLSEKLIFDQSLNSTVELKANPNASKRQ